GAGGCRRGDEHWNAGGKGSWQHGRSRFQPDQASRSRRDRQANAHDARRADNFFDRQRRGEIFRDHPGHVHGRLSADRAAQYYAARFAPERDSLGSHFQRDHYHPAHPVGFAWRAIPSHRRGAVASAFAVDLWRRRSGGAFYRYQTDRFHFGSSRTCLGASYENYDHRVTDDDRYSGFDRIALPICHNGFGPSAFSLEGKWQPDYGRKGSS